MALLQRSSRVIVLDRPTHRAPLVWVLAGLLVVLGVAAVGGGLTMVLAPAGELIGMDTSWLSDVPFVDDWLIPGLVLAVVLGGGSLAIAHGLIRQPTWEAAARLEALTGRHWAWSATIAMGGFLIGWIAVQLLFISERLWLQWVCLAIGAALMALPLTRPVQRDLGR